MTSGRHCPRSSSHFTGPTLTAVAALLITLVITMVGTARADWTTAEITNSATSVRSGSLLFRHEYPNDQTCQTQRGDTTKGCSGTLAAAAGLSTSVSRIDTITNLGATPASTGEVRVSRCELVSQPNAKGGNTDPMLPHHAIGFQAPGPMTTTNAVTLDGTTGYLSDIIPSKMPNAGGLLGSVTLGNGIWFRAKAGDGGPLLSFSDQPATASTKIGRQISLNANGTVSYRYAPDGSAIATSGLAFNDDGWHFAYARTVLNVLLGIGDVVLVRTATITLYVDGGGGAGNQRQVSTGTLDLLSLGNILGDITGYWHLGIQPGVSPSYFKGSLSNAVVFDQGSAPTASLPTSQAAMTTFAGGASQHWLLGSPGTQTTTAAIGYLANQPCAQTRLELDFTNPLRTVGPTTLGSLATNAVDVPVPAGGATSTMITVLSRGPLFDPQAAGLHLLAPLSWSVDFGGGWRQSFDWDLAASRVIL